LKRQYAIPLLIAGITLAGLTGFQIITSLFGAPILMSVNGKSMSPVFEQFDLLIMELIEPEDIEIGMIVAVDHRADGHFFEGYVVHRVVEMKEIDGDLLVRTKGDFNDDADELVYIEDVVAKVLTSIPVVGFVLSPPVNAMIILSLLYLGFRFYSSEKISPSSN